METLLPWRRSDERNLSCRCECHSHHEEEKRSVFKIMKYEKVRARFDFLRGRPLSYIPSGKNTTKSTKYSVLNFVPFTIFISFSRLGNLAFLVLAFASILKQAVSPFESWIFIIPLCLNTFFFMVKELFFDIRKYIKDRNIDKQECYKGSSKRGCRGEIIKWKDIQVGDILVLHKNDTCPADMILLDSSEIDQKRAICFIDTSQVDGKKRLSKKFSCFLTQLSQWSDQKNDFKEYRKLLSGKLTYEAPHVGPSFSACLHLKKDPKLETLTSENFIPRGSNIRIAEWVYGMVIYIGAETKIMISVKRKRRSTINLHEKSLQFYIILMAFVIIGISIVSIIVSMSKKQTIYYLKENDAEPKKSDLLLSYILLYSLIFPLSLYSLLDASLMIHMLWINLKLGNSTEENSYFKLVNPDAFPNLGAVKYALIDKTGTLTTEVNHVDTMYFNGRLYNINIKKIKGKKLYLRVRADIGPPNYRKKKAFNIEDSNRDWENIEFSNRKESLEINPLVNLESVIEQKKTAKQRLYEITKDDMKSFYESTRIEGNIFILGKSYEELENEIIGTNIEESKTPDVRMLGDRSRKLNVLTNGGSQNMNNNNTFELSRMDINLSNITEHPLLDTSMTKMEAKSAYLMQKSIHSNESLFTLNIDHNMKCFDDLVGFIGNEEDFLTEINEGAGIQLLEAIVLCHRGRNLASKRKDFKELEKSYESKRIDEETILEFAKCYGGNFLYSEPEENPSDFYVEFNNNKLSYKILGIIQRASGVDESLSVVAQNLNADSNAFLVCKGTENLKSRLKLDLDEVDSFDLIVRKLQEKGLKVIVLARRFLSSEESEEFEQQYKSITKSLIPNYQKLEHLGEEYETKLSLMAIIGLKEDLTDGTLECFDFFRATQQIPWIVSGDTKENVLRTALQTNLIKVSDEALDFTENEKATLNLCMKNYLSEIKNNIMKTLKIDKSYTSMNSKAPDVRKKAARRASDFRKRTKLGRSTTILNLQENTNFYVLIKGSSLEQIRSDSILYSHFIFVCSIVKVVLGFEMSSENKALLVKMIKTRFADSPMVLAIGDGFNDINMMQEADISLEIIRKQSCPSDDKKFSNVCMGDIQISNFSVIQNFLLFTAKNHADRLEILLYHIFYHSILFSLPNFYFNWFSSFSGFCLFDSFFIITYHFVIPVCNFLCYSLTDRLEKNRFLSTQPGLFSEGFDKEKQMIPHFILRCLFDAIIHSLIIFYTTLFVVKDSLSKEGLDSNVYMVSGIIMIVATTVSNIRVLIYTDEIKRILPWAGFSLSIIILFIILYITRDFNPSSDYKLSMIIDLILTRSNTLLCIFFEILICSLSSYFNKKYLIPKVFPNLSEQLHMLTRGLVSELNNSFIVSHFQSRGISLQSLMRKIFKKSDVIDSSLQELIGSEDFNQNALKMEKFTLKISDNNLEKKYNFLRIKEYMNESRMIFLLLTLLFGVFATLIGIQTSKEDINNYIRMALFILFFILIICAYIDRFTYQYYIFTSVIIIIFTTCMNVYVWWGIGTSASLTTGLVSIVTTINLNISVVIISISNLFNLGNYIIRLGVTIYETDLSNQDGLNLDDSGIQIFMAYKLVSLILLMGCLTTFSTYNYFKIEKLKRMEFLIKMKIRLENLAVQDILSILVPKFVKDRINQGITSMQEVQNDIGIIFCDIYDFDKLVALEATGIVQTLDNLYRAFDVMCLKYGIQKIETVGKTYMAAAGIKDCEFNISAKILKIEKTQRLINLALEMLEFSQSITNSEGRGDMIKLKIGIHTGKVIAAVLGYHKPQFSLIGDTVNTASRICSTGDEGKVTISEEAFKRVNNVNYRFLRKIVTAKGKGTLKTYQVGKPNVSEKSVSLFKRKLDIVRPTLKKLAPPAGEKKHTAFNLKKDEGKQMEAWIISNVMNRINDVMEAKKQEEALILDMMESPKKEPKSKYLEEDELLELEGKLIVEEDLKIKNRYLLTFQSNQRAIVKEFFSQMIAKSRKETNLFFFGLIFMDLFQILFQISLVDVYQDKYIVIGLRVGYLFSIIISCLIVPYVRALKLVLFLYLGLYAYSVFVLVFQISCLNQHFSIDTVSIHIIEVTLVYIVHLNSNCLLFVEQIIMSAILFVQCFTVFGVVDIIGLGLEYFFFFITMIIFNLLKSHWALLHNIISFNNLNQNESNKMEQEKFVSQLLPIHAFNKLKHQSIIDKIELTDEFDNVTLLFADIANFTHYSSTVRPEEVVLMVKNLFIQFDKMCIKFQVYKVYTIGDCYVVMGLLNAARRDPVKEACNVVNMALSMLDIIRDVRRTINYDGLDMRIGIHSGKIIGGIIGTDIVRYDIYGQNVLIANKMESNGIEGNIMISESTKQLLERDRSIGFTFEKKKEIILKNIENPISAYLLYVEKHA